jgi:hypothetical protein
MLSKSPPKPILTVDNKSFPNRNSFPTPHQPQTPKLLPNALHSQNFPASKQKYTNKKQQLESEIVSHIKYKRDVQEVFFGWGRGGRKQA